MEKESHRYSGLHGIRQSYMHEFSVECPKCAKEAFVTVDNPWFLSNGVLKCFHCMYSQKAADLIRYNVIVKRNCDNCGKHVETVIPYQKEKTNTITISCPYCDVTRTHEPRNEAYKFV